MALAQQLRKSLGDSVTLEDAYRGPVLLRRALGTALLDDFRVVVDCRWKAYFAVGDTERTFLRRNLARFEGLESLSADGPDWATGLDFESIAACNKLTMLLLHGTDIRDEQLPALAKLHGLVVLDLSQNPTISNGGLAALAGLQRLESIDLSATGVSGDGIAALRQFGCLKRLHLDNLHIDDNDVEALGELKTLDQLSLAGTKITVRGRQRLQALLPKCRIFGLPDDY